MPTPLLPPTDSPDFPIKLKELRELAGLSGAELSRRAGIAPTMVPRYESATRADRHVPRPDTVRALERELLLALKGDDGSKSLADFSLDEILCELKNRGFTISLTFLK